jgi:5'-deoxynucleotidase YfbR-like HD superfamily hydrolase
MKDNVATHSYYVTVYSYMIAKIIKWEGPKDYLMLMAALHDNNESITGDITGPVKSSIMDEEKIDISILELTEQRMEGLIEELFDLEDSLHYQTVRDAQNIVKVADKLDALLFLIMNQRMGNTFVEPALEGGMRSLEAAWSKLPGNENLIRMLWQTTMLPAIQAHRERGARGCAPGVRI